MKNLFVVILCMLTGICCLTSCGSDTKEEGTNFNKSKFVVVSRDEAEPLKYISLLPGQTKQLKAYIGTGMKKYNGVATDWSISNNSVATVIGKAKTMRSLDNSNRDERIEVYTLATITANKDIVDDTTSVKLYLHFGDIKRTITIPVHVSSLGDMAEGSFIQKLGVTPYSFTMCYVKGGVFTMGDKSEESMLKYEQMEAEGEDYVEETQPHFVEVSDYLVSSTEVTEEEYYFIMSYDEDFNQTEFERNRYPVDRLSKQDCEDFIKALNKFTGYNYRLLTEAEWEYAARGGEKSKLYVFSGSNNVDLIGWYRGNSKGANPNGSIHEVAQKEPNELGIYDMTGNVAEWCSDRYSPQTYKDHIERGGVVVNPTGATTGSEYVYRGGDYLSPDYNCRVSRRFHLDYRQMSPDPEAVPTTIPHHLGIRLAMSYEDYKKVVETRKGIIMEIHHFE